MLICSLSCCFRRALRSILLIRRDVSLGGLLLLFRGAPAARSRRQAQCLTTCAAEH